MRQSLFTRSIDTLYPIHGGVLTHEGFIVVMVTISQDDQRLAWLIIELKEMAKTITFFPTTSFEFFY